MPALPPIANVLRLSIGGTDGLFNWRNILHFQWSGDAPTVAILTGFNELVFSAWDTSMKPLLNPVVKMDDILSTDLTSADGAQVESPVTSVGTRAGAELPADACFLITYPVSVRYRGGHPRTYLDVGSQPDLVDPAHWTAGMVADVEAGWSAFIGSLIGSDTTGMILGSQCAVSYRHANAPRVAPLLLPIADNSGRYEAQLASQRRRIGRK